MKQETYNLIKKLVESSEKISIDMLKTLQLSNCPLPRETVNDTYVLLSEYFQAKTYFDIQIQEKSRLMDVNDFIDFEDDFGYFNVTCRVHKHKESIEIVNFYITICEESKDLVS